MKLGKVLGVLIAAAIIAALVYLLMNKALETIERIPGATHSKVEPEKEDLEDLEDALDEAFRKVWHNNLAKWEGE